MASAAAPTVFAFLPHSVLRSADHDVPPPAEVRHAQQIVAAAER